MAGQVEEGAGRQGQVTHLDDPVDTRVGEPQQQAAEHRKIAQAVAGRGPRDGDGERHRQPSVGAHPPRRYRRRPTISSVVSATATPAFRKASSLLFAVPRLPEMIAPAWPIRLPSGAIISGNRG